MQYKNLNIIFRIKWNINEPAKNNKINKICAYIFIHKTPLKEYNFFRWFFMIILNKKRIIIVCFSVFISIFTYFIGAELHLANLRKTVETVALPTDKKIIIIDAGHRAPRWRSSEWRRSNRG